MKQLFTLILSLGCLALSAQTASIKGQLQDNESEPVIFANVLLYAQSDSSLVKVETTDDAGVFQMKGLAAGQYFLKSTYIGLSDLVVPDISLSGNQQLDLNKLVFEPAAIELAEATVTASRAMVEIKPDRTIFNVQGTINSTGSDAIELLRKSPGVTVDNNDNINVLGRAGVLLYVDGKRLPLNGEELTNYLKNLPADQIDRIEIITNPGAKYEAEGNAGIIDIRLKRDENLGANGSLSSTFSQGQYHNFNLNGSGNYRNKFMNVFGTAGGGQGAGFHNMDFLSYQNNVVLNETNKGIHDWKYLNLRLGTDFFIGDNHTVGFLLSAGGSNGGNDGFNKIEISNQATPELMDSSLVANTDASRMNRQNTYNLNYRFDNKEGRTVNVDADYGAYTNDNNRLQDNTYYSGSGETILSQILTRFNTPTNIDIYSFKIDYEDELLGGTLGLGTKLSRVVSDNSFYVYDVINDTDIRDDSISNLFDYEENVYAGYINYARSINDKWSFSAGVRAEQTDAMGNLQAFLVDLMEPPVELNYLSWFPSAGLTWQAGPKHTLSLNYGRRINRPDYNVLNPFNNQLSQLSYEKGNPFLRPEIVNNLELGYTLAYRYNFKLSYSLTTDQITRLIGPDEENPLASFISWDNLAEQTIIGLNISAPVQVTKWWNAYVNASAGYLDNQADYGEGAVVDIQAFTYNFYQQSTFDLPKGLKAEISGWYSGPGVWGGVFKYEPSWSLNLGLQRRFLNDQLNVRVSANDIFFTSGWSGVSSFNGLESIGSGNWDSRRVSLSISYNFGNQKVKSRRRNTGIEDEAGRVGGGEGGGQ
ncbi:MAG: TonB-dependent receptor [Saprospiraceae bacterium]|nr:TonB-dependent receptor [Saprospiraceae bacterium]